MTDTHRHTDRQTTLRVTSVAIGRIYSMRAMRCGLNHKTKETRTKYMGINRIKYDTAKLLSAKNL